MDDEEEEFLQTCCGYGYNGAIDEIREKEFKRLGDELYLDHIGATQYPQSLLDAYFTDLSKNIYGNPHSRNPSSQLTTECINEVRNKILHHFNTDSEEYSVVFTSGTTAALRLVAECFDWQERSSLCFIQNSHTSVVGMRECALVHGASFTCITEKDLQSKVFISKTLDTGTTQEASYEESTKEYCGPSGLTTNLETSQSYPNLFVYPAMCNFSGKKYPLNWIKSIQDGDLNAIHSQNFDFLAQWYVMLDAASFVSTSHLDLKKYKADFIPVSFYKVLGFPTGIGALLVRNKCSDVLKKSYYGGGTVLATISSERFHVLRPSISDRFEDGTLPFLDIIAVGHGLDNLYCLTGGMQTVCEHTFSLAQFVYKKMDGMRHSNGAKVCKLYCGTEFSNSEEQGPVVNFNLLRSNGAMIGYGEVDKFACLFNIHLRTGSFCNTGASQQYLGISNEQLKSNYAAGHMCGDDVDLIDGQPTGSVRISFGYMSTFVDAQRFLNFIRKCFIENDNDILSRTSSIMNGPLTKMIKHPEPNKNQFDSFEHNMSDSSTGSPTAISKSQTTAINKTLARTFTLKNICLYPVKSCGAFEVSKWQIGSRGFIHDRQWMIINESHICLSQKREHRLCLIRPYIDADKEMLKMDAPGMPSLKVKIIRSHSSGDSKVCKAKVNQEWIKEAFDCGDEAADWVSSFLGKKCRLVQQKPDDARKSKAMLPGCKETTGQSALSLANVSQYLLISQASVEELHKHKSDSSEKEDDINNLTSRFRGNLIIDGDIPFDEDQWKTVKIGQHIFQFQGLCTRCQMICLDQQTAERTVEPLKALGLVRRTKVGTFGIGLVHMQDDCTNCKNVQQQQYLQLGDEVYVVR